MKEIRVGRVPFETIFKISFVSALSASVLALIFICVLHLFVAFPVNLMAEASIPIQMFMWFVYFVLGPLLSAFGLSVCGWLGIVVLSRFGWIEFQFITAEDQKSPNKTPLPTPVECPPSNHDQVPGAADL